MTVQSTIRLLVKTDNAENIPRLGASLQKLAQNTNFAQRNFKQLSAEFKAQQATATRSVNGMRDYASALRELANNLDITSREFREATREADKFERAARKAQGKRGGGRLAGIAKGVGGVAAAGIFGGPEGALGAGIGAIAGGPVGAAVGGAIGAQVGQLRQQLGATAEYAAELQKQRIALAGLNEDYESYARSLKIVEQLSNQFAIPQEIIIRQFTKLSASVIGAGGDIDDAKQAFEGIAAGVRGTGGSLQDLDSALTATSQVFSKGKVSAEELRQQIGERLPGAFTLFAESLGMTPAELDKALEGGKVSLQDFQAFSELLFSRYGKSAAAIVNGPAAAGDRLQVALSKLSENVGKLLQPIGAAFQNVFTGIINLINDAAVALNKLFKVDLSGEVENIQAEITKLDEKIENTRDKRTRQRLALTRAGLTQDLARAKIERERLAIGAGVDPDRTKGLPGAVPDAGGEGKKPVDASKEILALTEQRNKARIDGLKVQTAELTYLIQQQQIEEQLQAGKITDREAQRRLGEAEAALNVQIAGLLKGIGNQQIKNGEAQQKLKEKIQDQAIALGIINEKEAESLKAKRELANLDAFKDIKDPELLELLDKIKAKLQEVAKGAQDFGKDFNDAFQAGIESMGNLAGNLGGALANAFGSASDALADFITTGKASFADFAKTVLQDLARIFVRFAMFNALKGIFQGTGFMGFANGGIMTEDGPLALKRYARGGIANSPQLAMFGEGSTPEAYVPLPDGRSIPVSMQNGAGGSTNVTVNVDAKGTQAQGDGGRANALGKAVSVAVQAEIMRQKRPGGLLA